ncbi:flagellar P-ring protein (precursor) FlgI [Legionella geestiana]|uniref:Flagellar P-ring protein n=1 Tax=Legionella geestiana TaxID=45065 RepID=A0A0W0U375_9GAMM|nr:flagellar basal body P-ring protein FlgI [Legionella geestiana]KTD02071.1 flagellar P-ring protein (precursor) FlgI [Legionella geestiana]QBS11868.1 flagellar basal body P-ring protein FlgI [Legionella geestiana]QDQ40520.1 flagellar basal body P-ring protein FlgI [Legionella geestiana]STX53432.1 flagellar P-ring protein (precursor) FlgI [Legionella geestiana]
MKCDVRLQKILMLVILLVAAVSVHAARIKDITTIAGIRENQLIGYGLVVGLDGTGDRANQAPFTDQTFRNMLLQFGIRLPEGRSGQLKNIAAVAVSANLPPFARIGQRIDVTISSLGNATSLRGGTLLLVPLRGADNQIYAMAQGNVVIPGFGAQGSNGTKVSVNSTGTGRIPNGATVEKLVEMPYIQNGYITFELNQPDFTTAQRITDTINKELGYKAAQPVDAGAVAVRTGNLGVQKDNFLHRNSFVSFISDLENLNVQPGEVAAKVIFNSRTGTLVVGQDVTVSPVAVAHGNLSVSISETPVVSQPQPFARGRTVVTSDSDVQINQQKSQAFLFQPGASLKEIVDAINRVGAAPDDLIAILEAIKSSGALHAELEII